IAARRPPRRSRQLDPQAAQHCRHRARGAAVELVRPQLTLPQLIPFFFQEHTMKTSPLFALAGSLALAGAAVFPSPASAQDNCAEQAKKRRPSLFGAEGAG